MNRECDCPSCQGFRHTIRSQLKVLERRPWDPQAKEKIRDAKEKLKREHA